MNTGEEDEKTLMFVDRCDREFDLKVVWLEAVINPKRRAGTTHRIVSFETATRGAKIFDAMAAKYGLPNKNFPHCTRELKLRPFESYLKSEGIKNHTTVLGIRSDELDRANPNYASLGLDYPLSRGWTKEMVRCFWSFMPFDLGLPEHRGNCLACWKKSLRKLMTLAIEDPEAFKGFRAIEKHSRSGAGYTGEPRKMYRGNRSVTDIFTEARAGFERFKDPFELDVAGACSESCDVFMDDTL